MFIDCSDGSYLVLINVWKSLCNIEWFEWKFVIKSLELWQFHADQDCKPKFDQIAQLCAVFMSLQKLLMEVLMSNASHKTSWNVKSIPAARE